MPDYNLQLIDTDYWKVVDTDGKTPEIVFEEVKDMVKNAVDGTLKKDSELKPLWQWLLKLKLDNERPTVITLDPSKYLCYVLILSI